MTQGLNEGPILLIIASLRRDVNGYNRVSDSGEMGIKVPDKIKASP
jgi:hypothetical protein